MTRLKLGQCDADDVRLRSIQALQPPTGNAGLDRSRFDNINHRVDRGGDQGRIGEANDWR